MQKMPMFVEAFNEPYKHRAFFGCVTPGGWGIFHPLTPLSLKLDYSNFVQNYFGIKWIFCDNKNPGQIDTDVTMTSSLLC